MAPSILDPGASHDLAQSLDAGVVPPTVAPHLGEQGRELSAGDALSAAFAFFSDFDRRVRNQRVLDQFHTGQSVKSGHADPQVSTSETRGESEGTR